MMNIFRRKTTARTAIIKKMEILESQRKQAKTARERDAIDYDLALLRMALNPEKYHEVI